MSLTRKVAHNTMIQVLGRVISTAIGLVVIGMLTRHLSEAGFGRYYTIMVYLQLFGVFVDLGLYVMLVKKISEPDADETRIVGNMFTLRLITALVVFGLAPMIALFLPYPGEVRTGIAITSIAFLCITLTQALTGVFQKHLRMDRVAIADVVGKIALLGLTWWVVASGYGLIAVMGAVVGGSVLSTMVLFAFSRSIVRIRLMWDFALWKQIMKETWPIALSVVFNLIYFKADTVILSLMKTDADVGVYGASNRALEVIVTFPAIFAGLILPMLAAAWTALDRERFSRILQKAFDAMILLAVPLIGGTLIIAEPVMRLVTGEGFADSGSLLQILMIATGTIFVGNLMGNAVVAVNRQRAMMWLYLTVAVISLAGYLIVIPEYSYYGAAWMRVVSEILITIFASAIVIRATGIRLHIANLLKAVLATALMVATLWVVRDLAWYILALIGVAEYIVALYLLKAVNRDVILDIVRLRSS